MESMNNSAHHMNHMHMNHTNHMGNMRNYSDHSGHQLHMINHTDHTGHMTISNHSSHMNHMDHMGMQNHSAHMDHMSLHNHSDHMDHMHHDSDIHSQGHSVLQGDHSQHAGAHRMFFTTDAQDVSLLFEPWKLDTKSGMFFAIIVIIILAVVFEGMKSLRQYIHRDFRLSKRTIKSREHLLQTILYIVQIISSYVLMLAIMTYNVWVVMATICGLGLGYFLCVYVFSRKIEARRDCAEGTCSPECSDGRGKTRGTEKIEHELEPLHGAENMCDECRETDI